MVSKQITLRYPGTCTVCHVELARSTKAWWDTESRTATCQSCHDSALPGTPNESSTSPSSTELPASTNHYEFGVAGGSALREYEKRHERREQRIDEKWGRLAGVVKFLSDDPQNITAWAKGSDGERRLATQLKRDVGDRAIVLNDRKVPRTRGNIDHIVVAPSGVWVIDAKNYAGLVEHRDVGGWFTVDERLYVGGRDRTRLATGLQWQIDAVRTALPGSDVPITGALCFTDAEWRFFAKPFVQSGMWVTWAKTLVDMISVPGPLATDDVANVAQRLSDALPPEISTP